MGATRGTGTVGKGLGLGLGLGLTVRCVMMNTQKLKTALSVSHSVTQTTQMGLLLEEQPPDNREPKHQQHMFYRI